MKKLLFIFLVLPIFASAQMKYPPRDESHKSPDLKLFVGELKEVIRNKDSQKLITMLHPKVKFDFDEGFGIEKFKIEWKPEDKSSSLWTIMGKLVGLGGVFVHKGDHPFYKFVFPYINQLDLEDGDDYFNTLVVTARDVNVREKPDGSSTVVGQLTYEVITFDHEKSQMEKWYFIRTRDKKISGYVSGDYVYSPVDYRMFLTNENGKWQISCLIAGD